MSSSRLVPALLAVAFVIVVPATYAQEPAAGVEAQADPNLDEARRRFRQGVELARGGDCKAAIAEFEASYVLVARPTTLYNIAQCQEQLFRYDLAVKYYERYQSEAPPDDPDRPAVEATLRSLKNLLGSITVQTNVPAEVWLGNRRVGDAPGDVLVPAGRHSLEIRADGYLGVKREVEIAGRQSTSIQIELKKAEQVVNVTHVEKSGLSPAFFWTSLAATVAVGAAGTAFAIKSLVDSNNAKQEAEDTNYKMPQEEEAESISNSSRTADILFITTAVLAGGTTVLYFLTDWNGEHSGEKAPQTGARVVPIAAPTALGLSVSGRM